MPKKKNKRHQEDVENARKKLWNSFEILNRMQNNLTEPRKYNKKKENKNQRNRKDMQAWQVALWLSFNRHVYLLQRRRRSQLVCLQSTQLHRHLHT